jgi:hypothetical protein
MPTVHVQMEGGEAEFREFASSPWSAMLDELAKLGTISAIAAIVEPQDVLVSFGKSKRAHQIAGFLPSGHNRKHLIIREPAIVPQIHATIWINKPEEETATTT